MISSGVDPSVMTQFSGSLPVVVAIALLAMWWLDDELGELPDDGRDLTRPR